MSLPRSFTDTWNRSDWIFHEAMSGFHGLLLFLVPVTLLAWIVEHSFNRAMVCGAIAGSLTWCAYALFRIRGA
jgi:hypothetical protein